MAGDALEAHAHDELGINAIMTARPVQAALTSAATFTVGAALPLLLVFLLPEAWLVVGVSIALTAVPRPAGCRRRQGRRSARLRATLRVTFWGALAMAATAGIGRLVGAVV